MGILTAIIIVYLIGGLTFLPCVLLLVFLHAYSTFPIHSPSSTSHKDSSGALRDAQDDEQKFNSPANTSSLAEKFHRRHEPDVAAGYFAVCREYVPGGINGKPPERTTPAGSVVATESPSVYQSMYRSIFDRRQGPTLDPGRGNGKTVKRARNIFFVVLRHGHLMLYEDSEQVEVKHVISLELHDVGIYGGEELIPEGELWIKRNSIRLQRKSGIGDPTSTSKPFFFFSDNCSEKEDFYFALLQNQDVKPDMLDNPPRPQLYETKHIISLVQRLHSSEEYIQTRWLNALVGRLFLALYKTRTTEEFVRKKITKKIARVKKPAFLSDIVLQTVDMGDSAPQITNPRLKDLTIDGDCCAEADFKYNGNFRLEIAATARIDLGARFKAREVNLVLAVVVKKLTGHALVKFKPPPSNRIWISFESMPDLEMAIEPIVSSRQITYGIILRAIESRIREVFAETLVLPHWDDSPFTETGGEAFRGGIWAAEPSMTHVQPEPTKIPDEAPEDEADADVETDAAPVGPALPRAKDERAMSLPLLSDAPPSVSAASSTQVIAEAANGEGSAIPQKRNELPRALRSRSFASAADPLLSMDNANVESAQAEQKVQQQQDAASIIKAITSRPRPTSPSESAIEAPMLWEKPREASGPPSLISQHNDHGKESRRATLAESPIQPSSPQTPTSTGSHSTKSMSGKEASQWKTFQGDSRNLAPPDKRQAMATFGAATAAAKTWGWGVLNRSANQKNSHGANQDHVGTPSQPIGRGRPLPPPGQPLPFPEGARSKTIGVATPKRKPIPPPALPQRKQDEVKARTEILPPLPLRKRHGSKLLDNTDDEGLLVVEAPPESEPSSPTDEGLTKSAGHSETRHGNAESNTDEL